MALRRARRDVEECLDISRVLDRSDTLFSSQLLLARIDAAEGKIVGAVQRLGQLQEHITGDIQLAEVHYWLWKIADGGAETDNREENRSTALRLYTKMYKLIRKPDYRRRIDELTATATPENGNAPE